MIRNRMIHGQSSPTLREINNITGKSSPRSAVLALERLEKSGLITRISGNKIRLTSESLDRNSSILTVEVPLVGEIAAGAPILAMENVEAMIAVTSALARPGHDYFLLRVIGNSMDLATVRSVKIEDGCIVLVRKQPSAETGEIVVALLNDSATVKYFNRTEGAVILRPKSTKNSYQPIVLTENCMIQGVVVAVLPQDLY